MAAPRKRYHVIGDTWLNIREEPSKLSRAIGRLEVGEAVTVNPSADTPVGWFELKDGGFVMGEFLN